MRNLCAVSLIVVILAISLGVDGLRTTKDSTPAMRRVAGVDVSGMNLKKLVMVHRHCARTPITNTDGACDPIGCGMCTHQGELMLKSTGESYRERYGQILTRDYMVGSYNSISDTSPRTIQSSAAFLTGLFAYNSSYTVYPATQTTGGSAGTIDPWSGQPTYKLHSAIKDVGAALSILPNVTDYISYKTLREIGEECKLPALECDVVPWACAAQEIDFIYAIRAMGKLSQFPIAEANLEKLHKLRLAFERAMEFGYDYTHNDYFTQAGWPGHVLYDSMLSNAGADDGFVLHEYSGHDTTIMPLYSAMGNYTWVYPEFATSVTFEVYTNPNDSSNPYVLIRTALPEQLPGSHPLTWYEYEVVAMNVSGNGEMYTTTGACPLKDLQAYANTRRGQRGSAGRCYAWPGDLELTLCDNKSGAKPFGPCKDYREACPLDGCGAGAYMKSDYSCNTIGGGKK